MTKKEKVVEFVKTHKKHAALAAGAVACVAIYAITKRKPDVYVDLKRPELFSGEWHTLTKGVEGKYKDCVSGFVKAVDITDLGNFGDALATIEGIDGHEPIRIMFGTEKSFI